jgi:RHS repeat-associated protein
MASEVYTYDNVGNLLTKKIGAQNPKVLEYEYFAGYRVQKITEPDGRVIEYTYDANDNILTQSCPGVSYTYSGYDARNRVHGFTAQMDGNTFDFAYNYDVFGRMTAINYPNRTNAITYNYDELDRLQSIPGFVTSCSYDLDNKITDMLFGNGVNNHYEYRANDDKLANIQVGPSGSLLNLSYSYDNVGNITQINNDFYSYDGLNRLTWAGDNLTAKTGTGTAWSYDATGNRINHQIYTNNVLGEDISYSYDVANRLWSGGMTNYTNDNTGARLSKANGTINWTYQYDGESRLIKALNNGAVVTENAYDGSGMRVKKIADGKTVYFVYNGNDPLIEYSATDSKYTYYVYAGKQAVAEETGGVVRYYHKDHLGSTRVVTDVSGAKVAEYTYEPFGKVIAGTDGEQSFTGKKEDSTGLIYFGARFYDPEIGRFITADTYTNLPNDERVLLGMSSLNQVLYKGFDNPQNYNRYSYCLNNSLRYTDSDGHSAGAIALGAVGVGVVSAAVFLVPEIALPVMLVSLIVYDSFYSDTNDGYTAGHRTPGGRTLSGHAAGRANDRGFTDRIIDNIVNNNARNREKQIDEKGRVTWKYTDKRGNTVIVNENGDVVTVYGKGKKGAYVPSSGENSSQESGSGSSKSGESGETK